MANLICSNGRGGTQNGGEHFASLVKTCQSIRGCGGQNQEESNSSKLRTKEASAVAGGFGAVQVKLQDAVTPLSFVQFAQNQRHIKA